MMRKIFLAAAFVGLCANTVYATDNIKVDLNGNNILIEAKTQAESENAIRVMKKDGQADNKNDLYALKNVIADENGIVSFEFAMPDEKNEMATDGDYTITVKQRGKEAQSVDFTYISTENRLEAVRILSQSGDIASVIAVDSEYYDALKCAGIDLDNFHNMPQDQQTDAINVFSASMEDEDDENSICEKFVSAVNISYVNQKKVEYIKELNPVFEEEYYQNIASSAKIEWINSYLSDNTPYGNIQAFEKAYIDANMLYAVNNSRFDVIDDTLLKYAKDLGYENENSYKAYRALTTSKKEMADEYMTGKLSASPAKSLSELIGVMGEAVAAVNTTSSSGSSSGSNGGGGGSSSNKGSGVYVPTPVTPSETTEEKIEKGFTDVYDGHWAKEAIDELAKLGVVSGNDDGSFAPSRPVTREEYVTMLVRAYGLYDETSECEFDDVTTKAWYYKYVASAVKAGIVAGVDYNKFGAGSLITRQDMAVMSYRVMQKYGKTMVMRDYEAFADEVAISEYAKESVMALYSADILNGDENSNFNPQSRTTRAEAAIVIFKLIKGGE